MPRTGQAHLSLWFLMQCNMGKQCPRAPQIFIHISHGNSLDKRALHLYLTDSVEVVLNLLSKEIFYHASHFYIIKAEQCPQFVAACTGLIKQYVTWCFFN